MKRSKPCDPFSRDPNRINDREQVPATEEQGIENGKALSIEGRKRLRFSLQVEVNEYV
jgi:hypothetical protein